MHSSITELRCQDSRLLQMESFPLVTVLDIIKLRGRDSYTVSVVLEYSQLRLFARVCAICRISCKISELAMVVNKPPQNVSTGSLFQNSSDGLPITPLMLCYVNDLSSMPLSLPLSLINFISVRIPSRCEAVYWSHVCPPLRSYRAPGAHPVLTLISVERDVHSRE